MFGEVHVGVLLTRCLKLKLYLGQADNFEIQGKASACIRHP